MFMNVKVQLLVALLAAVAMGAVGIELARATAKPPAFMVVEYEITDPVGFRAYIKGADAIHSSRIFLARHAKGTSLSGEPPKWIGILQYPSLEDAIAFDSSPEYSALKSIRDRSTKWRSFVVEGLEN
jgi:uncharacterized protein (DUF1330 family)